MTSFYVHRENPGTGREGWVGPIRSERQADREVAAWIESGWLAEKHESSPAVRSRVREWEKARA